MTDPAAVAIRDAATVMLVRDGDDARLEVFMLRRNLNSDFVGGAYVFPGGAVDPADRHADLEPFCEGRSDADASTALGLESLSGGLAYWVAAVRESFEEAGVLLAYDVEGEIVDLRKPAVAERFDRHRSAVDHGERRLVEICAEEGLRLAVDGMHYFSHWITPMGPSRRYDTRFFVTAAPVGQTPLHDDRETIANCWIAPSDALTRHEAGEFDLILPTIRNLEAIARFDTAAAVLAAAATLDVVPAVLPRVINDGAGIRILLPGDAGYDAAGEGLPVGMPLPGRPGGPAT